AAEEVRRARGVSPPRTQPRGLHKTPLAGPDLDGGTRMSRWRIVVVLALVAVPFLVLAGGGEHFLYGGGVGVVGWGALVVAPGPGDLRGASRARERELGARRR